jgi:tellurite resistance protein TerC
MYSTGQWWMWLSFMVFVVAVIAIDIFLLKQRASHKMTVREAGFWVMLWFLFAMLFNALLGWYLFKTQGSAIAVQKAMEFFSGYLIELSLSVDNMFVFIMIFSYFAVPPRYQRRVLLYGVLSAIVLRFLMIVGGTWLVREVHGILYLFGAFLIFTGIKMLLPQKEEASLDDNRLLIWLRQHMRLTKEFANEHFFVKKNSLWYATPLFLTLVFIELSDVIFALDSIPAIFAVTNDTFIIFTSNMFAIMGLRAMYFLLSNMAEKFHLLRYGIALMLTFVGVKMLLAYWVKIPITFVLGILIAILGTTIFLSMVFHPRR